MFGRLLDAMGRADLRADPRLATTRQRLAHRQLVDDLVTTWVGERTAEDVLATLAVAEVPSSLVMSVRDLFEDPHVRARGNIISMATAVAGALAMPGVVPRLTLTPGDVRSPGPITPGQDNEEIYGERLGLDSAALARLRGRGVI
jgi:crotonobetainyl-CoA:carnitine CoA-transferase CaiB-like acyl-CoA transferase